MRNFTELDNVTAKIDTATVGVTAIVGPAKVNDFRANWSRATGKADSVIQSLFGEGSAGIRIVPRVRRSRKRSSCLFQIHGR